MYVPDVTYLLLISMFHCNFKSTKVLSNSTAFDGGAQHHKPFEIFEKEVWLLILLHILISIKVLWEEEDDEEEEECQSQDLRSYWIVYVRRASMVMPKEAETTR